MRSTETFQDKKELKTLREVLARPKVNLDKNPEDDESTSKASDGDSSITTNPHWRQVFGGDQGSSSGSNDGLSTPPSAMFPQANAVF